jgi:hypothetical protein
MTRLQSTYLAKHAVIMAHLAAINEHMNDLPEPESIALTWADVGDLTRLENDLTEILEYLS